MTQFANMESLEELLNELDLDGTSADVGGGGDGMASLERELSGTSLSATQPQPIAAQRSSIDVGTSASASASAQPTAEEVLAVRTGTIQRMWKQRDQLTADERLAAELQESEFDRFKNSRDFNGIREGISLDRSIATEAQTAEVVKLAGRPILPVGNIVIEGSPIASAELVDQVAERLRQRLATQQSVQAAATMAASQTTPVRRDSSSAPSVPVVVQPQQQQQQQQQQPISRGNSFSGNTTVVAASSPTTPAASSLAPPPQQQHQHNATTMRRNNTGFYRHNTMTRQQAVAHQLAVGMPGDLSDEETEPQRSTSADDNDDDDLDLPSQPPPAAVPPAAAAGISALRGPVVARQNSMGSTQIAAPANAPLARSTSGNGSGLLSPKQQELEVQQKALEREINEWRFLFRQANGYFPQYKDMVDDKKNMKKKLQTYRDLRRKAVAAKPLQA